MNILHTLKTNWRDILVAVVFVLGLSYLADKAAGWSVEGGDIPGFSQVVASLQGFSDFFAANICAFFGLAVAWPTLNKFSNGSFKEVWDNYLTPIHRFFTFIIVAVAYFIGACLCFSH